MQRKSNERTDIHRLCIHLQEINTHMPSAGHCGRHKAYRCYHCERVHKTDYHGEYKVKMSHELYDDGKINKIRLISKCNNYSMGQYKWEYIPNERPVQITPYWIPYFCGKKISLFNNQTQDQCREQIEDHFKQANKDANKKYKNTIK